jgi:hypothetical protein
LFDSGREGCSTTIVRIVALVGVCLVGFGAGVVAPGTHRSASAVEECYNVAVTING